MGPTTGRSRWPALKTSRQGRVMVWVSSLVPIMGRQLVLAECVHDAAARIWTTSSSTNASPLMTSHSGNDEAPGRLTWGFVQERMTGSSRLR